MCQTSRDIKELQERVAALEARPDASKVLTDLALLLTHAPRIREQAISSALAERVRSLEALLAEAKSTTSTDRS